MEEIEAQLLRGELDSARSMHAWAARELHMLSESIRGTLETEMKTARPVIHEKQEEEILSFEDIIAAKSECIVLNRPEKEAEILENLMIPKSSARSPPEDLSLSSDDSVFRSFSPLPYLVEARADARPVLQEYVEKTEKEKEEKRLQLRLNALRVLNQENRDEGQTVHVQRRSKGGVAMQVNLFGF